MASASEADRFPERNQEGGPAQARRIGSREESGGRASASEADRFPRRGLRRAIL